MISDLNYDQVVPILKSNKEPMLFFMYTPLCGTCKLAHQMLELSLMALNEPLKAFECNINLMPNLAKAWEVESVPCLIFIREGKLQEKVYSVQSVDHLYIKLKKFVKSQ